MANKENLPPALTPAPISSISPSNKPALSRQRDHSACRRPETPLKVRKTRENLKHQSVYTDIPPPCLHLPHPHGTHLPCSESSSVTSGNIESTAIREQQKEPDFDSLIGSLEPRVHDASKSVLPPAQPAPAATSIQRQKSASRRMLFKVKQTIASRSKAAQPTKTAESETNLIRRISGRRKLSSETDYRSCSFEVSRDSIRSDGEEAPHIIDSGRFVERSFTDSTVSTAEIFGHRSISVASDTPTSRCAESAFPDRSLVDSCTPPQLSCLSPQPTLRPLNESRTTVAPEVSPILNVLVPCIVLDVIQDCTSLDVHAKRDVWVAMKATVRASPGESSTDPGVWRSDSAYGGHDDPHSSIKSLCGAVSSLKLCFKPKASCLVRDVVGRKNMKDLQLGQECQLFIRLHVPKIRPRAGNADSDQESLFTELESIVGTLETEMLHIEARYRHSLLPSDNVVSVRHICKIQRPRTDSRWSMVEMTESTAFSIDAQTQLARYLASECLTGKALELMQEYLDSEAMQTPHICEIRNTLAAESNQKRNRSIEESKPSVIVTDVDWNSTSSAIHMPEQFSTAPSTPAAVIDGPLQTQKTTFELGHRRQPSSLSLLACRTPALPLISAPKATTALSTSASPSSSAFQPQIGHSVGSQDRARQLWHHIRRNSLSMKQLEEMSSERVEHLEASDDTLKEIRRRALANKRSIGADTLKGWKWEDDIGHHGRFGEAPWM